MPEAKTYPIAFDENGPIEVEIIGAQPVGDTIINGVDHDDKQLTAYMNREVIVAPPAPVGVTPAADHAVRTHHKYGMSKLGYLNACPGFTSTDGSSEAAEQGTRLHEIMDILVEQFKATRTPLLELLSAWCAEHALDNDERALLVNCINHLNKWLPKAEAIHNEIKVSIFNPDDTELNHGYLDLLAVFPGGAGLLIDYKFGWVPVPAAANNIQGKGYTLGSLMKYHCLNKVVVMFIQPKLNLTTTAVFHRSQINEFYQQIRQIIDRAEMVQRDPKGTEDMLSPSDYCSYCLHAKTGSCPAKVKQLRQVAVAVRPEISGLIGALEKINTPEQAAKLRFAIEQLESGDFFESAKAKCKEIAQLNGGEISFETPTGETIRYAIEDRRHDRSLGDTLEVATTLNEQKVLTLEETLCCADLSITKLEAAGTNAIYEKDKAEYDRQVKAAEARLQPLVTAGKITKTAMNKEIARIKAEFKCTKKESTEAFQKILENQGLLSRPDGTIPVLRRKKNETPKQLKQ
jgi:hypothetical protein